MNGPLMDWSIRISSSIFASTNLFNQFSANSEPLNCNGLNTSYLLLSVTLTLRVIAADYFLIFYFLFITVSHSDCACDNWKLFATRPHCQECQSAPHISYHVLLMTMN